MKYLVTSPPVITPSEPPSGAFLLAGGLAARGIDAGFLDLSLAFFRSVFSRSPTGRGYPDVRSALDYLRGNSSYTPQQHRTASGILNSALRKYSDGFPGWRITLMDAVPPEPVHMPQRIKSICEEQDTPFTAFWQDHLLPVLHECRPERVLVSLSYLSQLAGGIDLVLTLKRHGFEVVVGGSLLNSLSRTGEGFRLITEVMPEAITGDGSEFPGFSSETPLLDHVSWPVMLEEWDYISGRPVIPCALSTGCYWNRCLFCPDAGRELRVSGADSLDGFLASIPAEIMIRKPLIHFLDSAAPREPLMTALPLLKRFELDFYTFARPEPWVPELAGVLSEHGCLMLQLGVESGSRRLLDRYCKGISPEISLKAMRKCADAGIRTYVYMLLGLPGETDEDIESSISLLREAGPSVDFINFSIFNLPENCQLTERADEFGIQLLEPDLPDDSIRLYRPFLHEGNNPRVSARASISRDFPRIPSVSEALKRTPNWFRTTHFPLIEMRGRN
jgi:hypothetical protein